MKNKIIYVLFSLLLLLILSSGAGYYVGSLNTEIKYIAGRSDTTVVVDTVLTPADTITLRASPEIKYVRDTLISVRPFVASMDTVMNSGKDTVEAEYVFPENIFSLAIRRMPDTTYNMNKIIFRDRIREEKREWWEIPVSIAGGIGVGLVIGVIAE